MTGQRVIGLETEYAIVSTHSVPVPPGTAPPLTPEQCIAELYRGTAQAARSRNRFLGNGGRLYVDLGSHPEYATAECRTIADVVAQDRAGEAILTAMAVRANERLAADGIRIHVVKNNVDRAGRTFGCHENYQVPRELVEDLDQGLVAFLAARPVLTGSGGITPEQDGRARYVLSTRAGFIERVTSPDPTAQRPLIVTREEPLADGDRYARLQVTYGDSNVCDVTTALKLAVTSAALAFLEAGGTLKDLELSDPIGDLRRVAVTGPTTQVTLADGRTLSAVDIQEETLTRSTSAALAAGVEADLLARAGRAITALRSDPDNAAADIDWIGKRRLLAGPLAEAGGDWGAVKLARLDLAFHDLDPERGLAPRLRRSGLMNTVVTDAEVSHAMVHAPSDTRALVRGMFVKAAEELGLDVSVSWTHLRLDSPPRPQIDLLDALASSDSAVEKQVAEMRALPPRKLNELERLRAGLGALG